MSPVTVVEEAPPKSSNPRCGSLDWFHSEVPSSYGSVTEGL